MGDGEVANEGGLVTLGQRGVTARSSGVAERGLELLASLEAPQCCVRKITNALRSHGIRRKRLDLVGTEVTDRCLQNVAKLTGLEELDLFCTGVTDAGLVHLRALSRLRHLDLSHTDVTDAGLVHLAGLTTLRHLELDHTHVTDPGLVHLAALIKLEELDLGHTRVTDAGLRHLTRLTRLTQLVVTATQLTDAGLAVLPQVSRSQLLHFFWTELDGLPARLWKLLAGELSAGGPLPPSLHTNVGSLPARLALAERDLAVALANRCRVTSRPSPDHFRAVRLGVPNGGGGCT